MPKITQTSKGGTISFGAEDFLAGLYPQYQTTLSNLPGYISDQLLVASAFHPYRALGYAAPGFDATDLTNVSVMTDLGRNIALASESGNQYGYIICGNNRLNRLAISGASIRTFSNSGSWPHTIVGAGAESGDDVITYNANVSSTLTPCIFYSWNDSGGAWDIGRFETTGGTFDDTFVSTITPSGNNKPHPMKVGADDILYIGDGNEVHGYDGSTGADGTFIDAVLTLPAGYIVTSFAKLPDYLVIFAYYSPSGNSVSANVESSGPAIAVLWNYLDLDPTYVVPLGDNTVTAGFEYQGTVGCFTQGAAPVQESANRFCTLQLWNGSNFEIVSQFIGNPPIHGGVDIVDKSIQWNTDGAVHCFGSPYIGAPEGLNKLGISNGSLSGLLRTIGGLTGFQIISSGTTTSGGAQYYKNSTYTSSALMQTSAAAPTMPPGKIAKITRVGVRFGKTSSGGRDLAAFLVKEGNSSLQFISGLQTVTSSTMSTFYDRKTNGAYFGSFQDLSLALQWSGGTNETDAPVVRSVDVEFEYENLVTS